MTKNLEGAKWVRGKQLSRLPSLQQYRYPACTDQASLPAFPGSHSKNQSPLEVAAPLDSESGTDCRYCFKSVRQLRLRSHHTTFLLSTEYREQHFCDFGSAARRHPAVARNIHLS